MGKYLTKRIVGVLFTVFMVITLAFFLLHAIPSGPFTRDKQLPEAIIRALEAKYNLDQPLWKQYIDYLWGVIRLDLGPSFQRTGFSVNELIYKGFPHSARIGLLSVVAALIVGVPVGIVSALKQNKWQDKAAMVFATLGVTIPSFVLGTLYIYVFSVKLGWVPTFGLKTMSSYIGPVVTLSGFSMAFIARLTRSSLIEVMHNDYIRTARAKGLSENVVIWKHALKNALIPVVTYVGPMIAAILTGSFVVEKIFAIPGMGKMFVESVGNRDYTVVMGATIFYAIFLATMILIVDIVYGLIDPRIKLHD